MASLRPSAAVLLTRGKGASLELFLVERSPELAAFASFWALPGGTVDACDRESGGEEDALRRCALRELFEETGVLLPPLALRDGERERARAELLASPARAERWLARRESIELAIRALRPICAVTTPPFGPLRFQNVFFHAELPKGEAPRVLPGELARGRFVTPSVALAEWRTGELPIVPPVRFLVEALAERQPEAAFAEAARIGAEFAAGVLHPVRFAPGVALAPLQTPTLPPATTTNCVLVGEERVYVVDPATYEADERARLFDAMERMQAEGRRFEGVLATHHHRDHVGSLVETAKRFELPVFAHAETLKRIQLDGVEARELRDGEALELGTAPDGTSGWRLHAMHTPGHAPGHLAFLEDRYRSVIAGDLVSTLSTIVIDPEDGHLATYLASLKTLLARGVRMLHPAHGPSVVDGPRWLRGYLEHRAEREVALVEALAAGIDTVEALVPRVYADTPSALHPLAARSLLSGLAKLEEEGRAARRGERWRIVEHGT